MTSIEAEKINWNAYKKWVSSYIKEDKQYYFRGQLGKKEWKLQTSFHRISSEFQIELKEYLDKILPIVLYHVSSYCNEYIDIFDRKQFETYLPLLQHHGFPTPLLDWTKSPYIAAYFAFREVKYNDPQCDYCHIYIFDIERWRKKYFNKNNLLTQLKGEEKILLDFLPVAKNNPRLIHQQGTYTISNVDDIERFIHELEDDENKYIFRKLISVNETYLVLKELDLMGINEMTLFPGLDGICQTMTSNFFSSSKVGKTPAQRMAEVMELLEKMKKRQ